MATDLGGLIDNHGWKHSLSGARDEANDIISWSGFGGTVWLIDFKNQQTFTFFAQSYGNPHWISVYDAYVRHSGGIVHPAETTKAPSDGCSCEDMVSMEDFEALREAVRELQGSIGTIEADNNDLMDGMMEMATCMSGMTDKYGKDTTMMPTDRERTTVPPTERDTVP